MATIEQIALSLTPGLGPTACRKLLDICTAEELFAMSRSQLDELFGKSHSRVAEAVERKIAFPMAEDTIRQAERYSICTLFCTDDDFPQRLNRYETTDCPVLLYAMGQADLNAERTVAIVGTRKATAQGRDTTERLVAQMKAIDVTTVSGLAYGIDTMAHKASLDNGIPTVAVLGHGLDMIYPAQNRNLAKRILENGGMLLTEYPIGTKINPRNFPARNRIIAAEADATIVVESSEKGGALITAAMASAYIRDVFAVPGRLTDTYSMGTNALIANNKAILLRSANDIAAQMNWPMIGGQTTMPLDTEASRPLNADESRVMELIGEQEQAEMEYLCREADMGTAKMAGLLFNLELEGLIKMLPGQMVRRVTALPHAK